MRVFRPKWLLLWLLLTAVLAGCGQKGPLYLPQSPAPSAASEQPPAAKP